MEKAELLSGRHACLLLKNRAGTSHRFLFCASHSDPLITGTLTCMGPLCDASSDVLLIILL